VLGWRKVGIRPTIVFDGMVIALILVLEMRCLSPEF